MVEAQSLTTCKAIIVANPRWAIRNFIAAGIFGFLLVVAAWWMVQSTRPDTTPQLIGAAIIPSDGGDTLLKTTWRSPFLRGCVRQSIHLLSLPATRDELPSFFQAGAALNGDNFSNAGFDYNLYEGIPFGLPDGKWIFTYRILYGCGFLYLIPWADVTQPLSMVVVNHRAVSVEISAKESP